MNFKIAFRAFEIQDAGLINELRSIEESENLIGGNKRYVSLLREKKWVEDIILGDHIDRFYFALYEKSNLERDIIGYTSISEIDHINKSCFWSGIKIHPKYQGKGYAKQTAFLILKYGFEELNMERIIGQCLEEHIVAKKMMEKVGFIVEALQRHSVFKNGKYHNQFVLSILRHEYFDLKKKLNL